jgi:uncharacterized Zn-binding protein involved in type VI secretion
MATATLPNVCKMPGPPAPFVPTPLPNIGQSGNSPDGYSTTVTIEGNPVGIRGCSFKSTGDVASQGTGGGLVSNNTQGPTKFIAPGALDVQIEGKNVQLLGDQMLNNCGPSGTPANSATMAGLLQGPLILKTLNKIAKKCNKKCNKDAGYPPGKPSGTECTVLGTKKHKCCSDELNKAKYKNVQSEASFDLDGSPAPHGGPCRPDVLITTGSKTQVYDFKFNCKSDPEMSTTQKTKYIDAFGTDPILIHAW